MPVKDVEAEYDNKMVHSYRDVRNLQCGIAVELQEQ